MGRARKKVCPDCGGERDHGASICRACYDKQCGEGKWLYYRGTHPIKPCPGCEKNWIIKYSKFCWDCYNLRRTNSWKKAVAQFALGKYHRHFWLPRDTDHQCAICGLKEPHWWTLNPQTNYGICRDCKAEKKFPTPKEQAYILAHALRPPHVKVPALPEEELITV